MKKVLIASAVRTPIGDFGGSMRTLKPVDLCISVMKESLNRAKISEKDVDQVIMGNCFSPLDGNIARLSLLTMGMPHEIPAYTVNNACASSSEAIIVGANAILRGDADIILAGGVESMSNAPFILESMRWGQRLRHGEATDLIWKGMQEYPVGGGMGLAAERLAEKYGISRQEQDELALLSHQRAIRAIKDERFKKEIVPVNAPVGRKKTVEVTTDEHPREDTSMESLSRLKSAFKEDGVVTAGNASGMNDGAAAVILMSDQKAADMGVEPMARIVDYANVAVDPRLVGIAPISAINTILKNRGLGIGDIQLFEVNEAFASYYIACEKDLGLDREITNVNGSGISLGHPVGCTGCRQVVTMLHEMARQDLRLGISSLCAGGGCGTAILLER